MDNRLCLSSFYISTKLGNYRSFSLHQREILNCKYSCCVLSSLQFIEKIINECEGIVIGLQFHEDGVNDHR